MKYLKFIDTESRMGGRGWGQAAAVYWGAEFQCFKTKGVLETVVQQSECAEHHGTIRTLRGG